MNNATITQALVQQCNEAICMAKRRQTTLTQIMAEEVLTTCSNIADHCGLIDLNALIHAAMTNLESGNPQTIHYGQQKPYQRSATKAAEVLSNATNDELAVPLGTWPVTHINEGTK